MSIVETVLTFVVIPVAVIAVVGVLSMMSKPLKAAPYKMGDKWPYGPIWWSAVDEHGHGGHHGGHGSGHGHAEATPIGGSASGTW